MSALESTTQSTSAVLADEFRAAIDDAQERVSAVLEPSCPTPAFLTALRDEVGKAMADPEAMPYPELADPEAYWEATVQPQAQSLRTSVHAIIEWLEQRIINTMGVAEAELKAVVDTAASEPGPDPAATRQALSGAIDDRCLDLHHEMARMLSVLPPDSDLIDAREFAADALRRQATTDVEGLKAAYLREAGGDEDHQRFAESQWSETFADRVGHREALLAGTAPWRHLELALIGYERTLTDAQRCVQETAGRLQSPLRDMPKYFLERFDDAMVRA